MKKYFDHLIVVILFSLLGSIHNANAQYTIPSKMAWWYDSRFGMFIHFGSYSYLGHGEWAFAVENWTKTNYQTTVSSHFNPERFNAGEIARLAKNAGMKYIVITAKHHEGFCMWQTAVQSFKDVTGTKLYDLPDFTVFNTRDILKELKDSCDSNGIRFCLYYSILDWNHPTQTIYKQNLSTMASMTARTDYINDMKAQLKELIDRYHPAIMWFDGDWTYNTGSPTLTSWWTKADGIDLYKYLIGLDPTLVVNERVFRGSGLGDYECPEQTVPDTPRPRPWETCQTMNNSWGYNAGDNSYKSNKTMIQQLVQVVSRDGNYLLNIGPKGDGSITSQSISILNGFGDWMKIYGESIYGTSRSPYSTEPKWGYYTKKSDKLYAHVFTWPAGKLLKVPSLKNSINKIYLLNDTTALLNYSESNGYIHIEVPEKAPNSINSVVVINVSGIPVASTEYIKISSLTVKGQNNLKDITTSGGTLQMSATVFPSNATDKRFTWSVSDTTIATISSTGLLTAKKDGKVTVFATANDESDSQGKLLVFITNQTNGIKEINDDQAISIFPNPVENGKLNIKQNGDSETEIEIYNNIGKQVICCKLKGQILTIDVSSLVPGVYSVKVSNNENTGIQKFTKNGY
jgi:alpha-L-fucosidase